ncbi:S8 family serine peptidase [Streptomyces sp. NPDC090445]|uniref:S53 family peptidase n=1 Tax=Streptomyces sp. NPDC090445 TaxID=3365963 RepID=UPI00380772E1
MRGRSARFLVTAAVVLGSIAAGAATAQPRTSPADDGPRPARTAGASSGQAPTARRVCPDTHDPGLAFCLAMIRTDVPATRALGPGRQPPGLSPQDIQSAYDLQGRGGSGRRVAIVVAFDYPNAEQDLAVYRRTFRLPPCTTANGCFRKVYSTGVKPPVVDPLWALEAALDIQAVSAACPDCKITLVEAPTARIDTSLLPAVGTASALPGVTAVNGSWGAGEQPAEAEFDFVFRPGIAYTFASGDTGGQTVYPSVSPNVTSVGGTTLIPAHHRHGWAESGWAGSGGGCSLYEPKPSFQHDLLCPAGRATPDVSAVADPATGLAVYATSSGPAIPPGWYVVGGTSLSAPLVAGMYARAGRPGPADRPNTYPYARPRDFHDIVIGCAGPYCAMPGYDLVTGIGTPHGVRGLRAHAR